MAHNILLPYPDFNNEFKIHINASDLQLIAFISYQGKHIVLYIRQLTKPQMRYTLTKE